MNKKLTLTLLIGLTSTLTARAQAPYDQFIMYWRGTGYTTNDKGKIVATSITEQDFITRVAADNNYPVSKLCFVYRAEKRDTAVVVRSTGKFIADVYQMEYTYTDVTNAADTATYRQTLLNDEYHTNATGSTFGIETKTVNKEGNISTYSYHGTFQYSMPGPPTPLDPEVDTVWVGNFSTGARIPYTLPISSLKPKETNSAIREARVCPAERSFKRGGEFLGIHPQLSLPSGAHRGVNRYKIFAASSANSDRSPFCNSMWAAIGWSRNLLMM